MWCLKWGLFEYNHSTIKVTPISIIILGYSFFMGIGLFYLATYILKDSEGVVPFLNKSININEILGGIKIMTIGISGYVSGYVLNEKDNDFIPKNSRSSVLSFKLLFFLFSLGILWKLNRGTTASFGVLTAILESLPFSILLYFALIYPKGKKTTIYVAALSIIIFVVNLTQLAKYPLIISMLPLLIYTLSIVKRKVYVYFSVIIISVFVTQFIFPFIGAARFKYFNEQRTTISISEAFDFINSGESVRVSEEVLTLDESTNTDNVLIRLTEIGAPSYVYKIVQLDGHKLGEGTEYVLFAFIPRLLWPDKPIISKGSEFTLNITGDVNSITSTGMSAPGELYWQFGYVAVFFGMFILGLIYAIIKNNASKMENPLMSIIVYFMIINYINGLAEWGSAFVGSIIYLIYSYLGLFFSKSSNKKRLAFLSS